MGDPLIVPTQHLLPQSVVLSPGFVALADPLTISRRTPSVSLQCFCLWFPCLGWLLEAYLRIINLVGQALLCFAEQNFSIPVCLVLCRWIVFASWTYFVSRWHTKVIGLSGKANELTLKEMYKSGVLFFNQWTVMYVKLFYMHPLPPQKNFRRSLILILRFLISSLALNLFCKPPREKILPRLVKYMSTNTKKECINLELALKHDERTKYGMNQS